MRIELRDYSPALSNAFYIYLYRTILAYNDQSRYHN